jgi:hypothetical protein
MCLTARAASNLVRFVRVSFVAIIGRFLTLLLSCSARLTEDAGGTVEGIEALESLLHKHTEWYLALGMVHRTRQLRGWLTGTQRS